MPRGLTLSAASNAAWRHPWQLSPFFSPDENKGDGAWCALVKPGFVNGRDATIDTPIDLEKPALGTVPVELTDAVPPHLVITGWRNPLEAGAVSETENGDVVQAPGLGYPDYFIALGVRAPATGGSIFADTSPNDTRPDPNRTREIRAADVFLRVPRIATQSDVQVRDPATDAQSVVISTAFENGYAASGVAPFRLLTTSHWQPIGEPTLLDRLLGTAVEPQTDELLIATLWIVSPPDADPDAVPDATWTPYPQHFVFWNLNHASRAVPGAKPQPPITLTTGLAFGLGDALFAGLLSPVNDALTQLDQFFSGADYSGRFWT